jgi:hypothetical protein
MSFYIKLPAITTVSPPSSGLTDAQLRASPVAVSIATLPVQVTVSNEVEIKNDVGNPVPIDATNLDIRDLQFAQDKVDISGSTVNLSPATISAISPVAGASTLAEQQTQSTSLAAIALDTTAIDAELQTLNSNIDVQLSTVATEVTASSIDSKLTATNVSLASIDNKLTSPLAVTSNALTDTQLRATAVATTLASTTISNFPATQAVSGTVTVAQATGTNLHTVIDSGSVTATISGTPNVNVTNASIPVTGTFFQATQPVSIASSVAVTGPLTDTQLRAAVVPVSLASTTISNFPATQAVSGTVTANLGTIAGASTSALQTTGNVSLSSIDSKIPSGLTVTTGRLQVELPSGSGGLTDAELRATPVAVSLSGVSTLVEQQSQTALLTSIDTEIQSINASLDTQLSNVATEATLSALDTKITATNVKLDSLLTELQLKADLTETQPVSVSGVATSALQTAGNASLASIDTKLTSPLTTNLSASTLAALENISIDNFPVTQAISASSLPLPAGAATSALQTTIDSSINTLLKPSSTLSSVTTVGSISNALPTGTNSIGQVTANAGTNLNTSALNLEATQSDIRTSVQLLDNSIGTVAPGAAGTGSNLTGGIFNTTLTTLTNGQQVATQVDNKGRFLNATSNGRLSYALVTGGVAGFAAGATANQDIFRISGSATKTVYIKKIRVSATATATQGNNIAVVKRSAANTGGTSVASTLVPLDSTSAASTASAVHYTAAPTSGTAIGTVRATKFVIPTTTSLYNPEVIFEFTENSANPVVLNGVAQGLGIILSTAPGAGNNFLINIEWDEE